METYNTNKIDYLIPNNIIMGDIQIISRDLSTDELIERLFILLKNNDVKEYLNLIKRNKEYNGSSYIE